MRPGWDAYFVNIADAVSVRGDCRRSKVGAVIVDENHVIVMSGYNGVEPGAPGCLDGACPRGLKTYNELPRGGSYENCIGTHAEENAVGFARQYGQINRLVGSTVYITREPCEGCYTLLVEAGIARAVWPNGERDLSV